MSYDQSTGRLQDGASGYVHYLILALLGAVLLGAAISLFLNVGNSSALTTVIVLIAGIIVVVAFLPPGKLVELSIGLKGIHAKVADQAKTIDAQGKALIEQQEMINKLVQYSMSASIFKHLCGIALTREYIYHDSASNQREFYFLRDNGLVRPRIGDWIDFNGAINEKNVAEIAAPTPIGLDCIRLRKQEIPPEMLADKGNLRPDALPFLRQWDIVPGATR